MTDILAHLFKPNTNFFFAFMATVGLITFLAGILKVSLRVPNLKFPFKTPFGKLPLFDGVLLYGIITLLLLGMAKGMTLLWD